MEKEIGIYSDVEAKEILDNFIIATEKITNQRKTNFIRFEKFVIDGEQWNDTNKPEGDKPVMTFNQSEDMIMTYQCKLFPRNLSTGTLSIGVKIKNVEDKKLKEKYEAEILNCYHKNKLAVTILEQAQNFFIGGAACFYFPKKQITNETDIISLDPTTIYLGWSGNKLTQFAFEDEISLADIEIDKKQNWVIEKLKNIFITDTQNTRKFKKAKRLTYWDEQCQIIKIGDNDFKITNNESGYVPLAWIPNAPKAHRHEGTPEAKKLMSLDVAYNERSSEFAARVKANTEPVLAAFTKLQTKDLEREDIKGIMKFDPEDRAEFLKLEENGEILKHLETLEKRIDQKMAINSAVKGDVKSNVSSLAMVYYFSPLMDRIGLKRVYWDEAFRELNKAILKNKFGEIGEVETDPIYEPVILTDLETKIKNSVLMVENDLMSHEDAIDELRGSENSAVKFNEIIEEKKIFKQFEKEKKPFEN